MLERLDSARSSPLPGGKGENKQSNIISDIIYISSFYDEESNEEAGSLFGERQEGAVWTLYIHCVVADSLVDIGMYASDYRPIRYMNNGK